MALPIRAGLAAALAVLAVLSFVPASADTAGSPAPAFGRTDPNGGLFPDSSLVDFRYLLDAPAGRRGFLKVDSAGHFAWSNGTRARFWGINISRRSVFIDRPTIDKVVDVLARAGTNMVRFEALDSIGGLLEVDGNNSTRVLNRDRLATVDYWTSKLRERGIYYYLDLLDFRTFREGDGVAAWDQIGRAAKPYAFFDRRLIELQKEYASQLLTHKNPFTGLRYVDDPALAMVELCNEHGLFFRAGTLDSLVEPYGTAFRHDWNRWLQRRYGSRDALKKAWGRVSGTDVLAEGETLADNTVKLPLFTALPSGGPNVVDVRRAPARIRDGVNYLYDVQRQYFGEMRSYLRGIGLKAPITGAVSNEYVPDVASVAAELDFTTENYYADHPAFAGKDWEGRFFYNDSNPLRSSSIYQLAPWLSGLRWNNKPVVVREWATVWPNRFRAVSIPEMAAYASLQDFDAVLLFGYEITRDPDKLCDFDHQADPTVWGLYGMGAQCFLRGDIHPSRYTATLQNTPDTFYRWPNGLNNLHRLSWFVRLNSTLAATPPPAPPHPAAPRFASRTIYIRPHGHAGKRGGRRGSKRNLRLIVRRVTVPSHAPAFHPSRALSVLPSNPDLLPGLVSYFHAAGAPIDPKMLETGVLTASNGEITRDQLAGRLYISSPRTVAVCGELPVGKSVRVGPFTLVTPTPVGAMMAVSLDGKPLAWSHNYLVKMVSRAENTGQALAVSPQGAPGKFHIRDWGKAPVKTFGRSEGVMILRRGSQTLLSLALTDGTWELLVRGHEATLFCDTPSIHGSIFEKPIVTTASAPQTIVLVGPARSVASRR